MKSIAFFDTEIKPGNGKILDIGSIKENGSTFHSSSITDFARFLQRSQYICGHNIFYHDLKYIRDSVAAAGINDSQCIDTLYWSPLLFPAKPYHALLKDDKLQTEETNNPLNDSIKARDLFFDEVTAFQRLDDAMKRIFYFLLKDRKEFRAFFHFLDYRRFEFGMETVILKRFHDRICEQANLSDMITNCPVELAYCLTLINTGNRYSITPPWVLKNFPDVERVMHLLRSKPCLKGCTYCNEVLDIHKGLKRFFGFDSYRKYAGEPLQEKAVAAAVANKSLLAVFPTGGGKSITFQVPALMRGENTKGLTVVISPLQSLMKDQVDNLEKVGITEAVTINGLLDPIERVKSMKRVEDGSASILYISPESLRSRTIEKLLLGRNVVRFVIDEAHCFSAWGQDFRVDYLYIGDFIKMIQEKKNLEDGIPVSCFTATAKPKVIEDICDYFREKLSLEMEIFSTGASRSNLHYRVFEKENEEEKYTAVRGLIEEKNCPTIIYVSRTGKADELAERLNQDGYRAGSFHGKKDKQEKTQSQDAFIRGGVPIMVATSAFGMGVDKKDVGMVIHYEISDSLENYIQEAGRAGRDENISADCYVLFNDEDLNKHFILLNQTKLSIQEIQQVWRAIKGITRFRSKVSQSALEIARKAGWDDNVMEIETRVRTAIAALEEAGYLKRGQNIPHVYADSILARNAMEAIDRINRSNRFDEKQEVQATRIIKSLISSKSRKRTGDEDAEARIDYLSDRLGIEKEEVIRIVNLLREEGILADAKDLTAFIKKKESKNRSLGILKSFCQIEKFLAAEIGNEEKVIHIKELNEQAEINGCIDVNPNKLKTVLNFWAIKGLIKRRMTEYSRNHIAVLGLNNLETLEAKLIKRHELAQFIVEYLYDRSNRDTGEDKASKEEVPVEFSVLELKEQFEKRLSFFDTSVTSEEIEDALFYLSRIEAIKIEGGFLVVYNALTIERIEQDNKKQYKVEDYQKLNQFYENKIQQIHIVGEYARKMIDDYKAALQFVDDYFQLTYNSFLNKYFKGSRANEIRRNITPEKFRQLFGELSPTQLKIINDKDSKHIVVAAGPGSGKTRILVHKLASLMLMEDVKHEQMLMVTFSRSAVTEFKKRLIRLIGNAAHFIEIKTFHSYCFDLLGRVGTLEKSDDIVRETTRKIRSGEVEAGRITKTVLVIDEAQDTDANEFELINALMEYNEDMRVIAVGDDDQNIFGNLMEPLVKDLLSEGIAGSTCVLTKTNEEALQITGLLLKNGMQARLIQSNEGFNLHNLYEMRFFLSQLNLAEDMHVIDDEAWATAKRKLAERFIGSMNLEMCINLIKDFEATNPKIKYRSDLDIFIRESKLDDFCDDNIETIFVSTIHKCKGREFDNVFLMLEQFGNGYIDGQLSVVTTGLETEEAKRQLYVALTRAKRNLTIHYNGNYLDSINVEGLVKISDSKVYMPPRQLALQLTYKDVWLDYFISCQNWISQLNSGDLLTVDGDWCRNAKGQKVLRFSKGLLSRIEVMNQKNYVPKSARIRFVVFWRKENMENEIRIILPELYLERPDEFT